jgi:hypothetical protein
MGWPSCISMAPTPKFDAFVLRTAWESLAMIKLVLNLGPFFSKLVSDLLIMP